MGWSAGLQEHPGEIKEHFDAILPTVTRVLGFFLPCFSLFLLETAEVPSDKGAGGDDALWKGPIHGGKVVQVAAALG